MSLVLLALLVRSLPAQAPIRGFPAESWKAQHEWEQKLRDLPEATRLRTYMRRMSSEPHHAGSKGSREVAEYALGLFKEWGLDARIETFEALLPYPTSRMLEMTEPVRYRAALAEPRIAEDSDSGDAGQLPTFNAYSAGGDVTAPLVYVNYGLPDDYEQLKRFKIDPKGKIVIARYGQGWRGTKVKVAQEHGAVACLLYSDPRDDGYFRGDTYPIGAFRPPAGVQRGSVMDMPLHVGDPLSPGWASEPGARKLDRSEARTIMKIPVLPISYEDASHLMRQLAGPVVPESWRGAFGFTYHAGPGPAVVHLKTDFDWATRPVYNVIARLPGSAFPDQWILYGNHHDAWVNGAYDPLSGASALLETVRAFSKLVQDGWRPRRTLMFALWDAEEFGLIGSTEWVEKHREELDQKLVAYLNSDSNGRGALSAGGSASLTSFYREVIRDVSDPISGKPLLDSRETGGKAGGGKPALAPLGAGSDYVPFVHHAGVASLNFGFGGEGGGVYHSIYDSFDWYGRFSDGDFAYGRALSALMATVLARLADAQLLPFDFGGHAKMIQRSLDEIVKRAPAGSLKAEAKEVSVETARLAAAAKILESEYAAAVRRAGSLTPGRLAVWNAALFRVERGFLVAGGLPGRPFYRHALHAPGLYSGYHAKMLPGVREAAEAGKMEEALAQLREVARVVRAVSSELGRIAAGLK